MVVAVDKVNDPPFKATNIALVHLYDSEYLKLVLTLIPALGALLGQGGNTYHAKLSLSKANPQLKQKTRS